MWTTVNPILKTFLENKDETKAPAWKRRGPEEKVDGANGRPKSVILRSENVFMKLNVLYREYVLLKKAPCGKWTPSLRAPCNGAADAILTLWISSF